MLSLESANELTRRAKNVTWTWLLVAEIDVRKKQPTKLELSSLYFRTDMSRVRSTLW